MIHIHITKKNVVEIIKTQCPLKLESCIRSMLYEYRYKNKKDFFICDLKIIKKAIKACLDGFECINQNGGFYLKNEIANIKKIIKSNKTKISKLNKKIE